MNIQRRLIFAAVLFATMVGLSGCLLVLDRSSKYPGIVGAEFTTRHECYLFHMREHQYDFIPYHLSPSRTSYGSYADFIEPVPAGARIKVVEAKFKSNLDAGFDYLIADLYISGRASPVRFEYMIGSPEEAVGIDKIWKKIE